VLFAALALSDPQATSLFEALLQHESDALAALSPARKIIVQSEIAAAFRAAFMTIAAFAAAGAALAWSIPARRL